MKYALSLLVLGLAVAEVGAQSGFSFVFPRAGWVSGYLEPGTLLVVADVDEGLRVAEVSEEARFSDFWDVIDEQFGGPGTPQVPGAVLTEAPAQLDAGDYAFAVGILRPEATSNPIGYELDAFFQLRLAGSSATALTGISGTPDPGTDPFVPVDLIDDRIITTFGSLAGMAVAQAKWSAVDDYIEFEPEFALAEYVGPPTAGPAAWHQLVFPEPTAGVMAILAAITCTSIRRRQRLSFEG